MRNCFYDVHKWLDDVEVEQVVWNFISDLRNALKRLRKTVISQEILASNNGMEKKTINLKKIKHMHKTK